MQYAGLFYAKDAGAMRGVLDAPYYVMGRHALCAGCCAADGGAMACAFGRMRNTKELQDALMRGGVRFDPAGGACAMVLAAYRLWGEDYPRHIEGPVGTAVIDQDAGKLYLSRDRMGEEAVFYAAKGACVAFSDSAAALLKAPFVPGTVDKTGLQEMFALGPARTPGLTPVAGLKELQPGCLLSADEHGQKLIRYFSLEARPHEEDEAETVDHVRYLIEDALERDLALHPAAMLSGGLDSTYLTFLAAGKRKMQTWSVGYRDDEKYFTQNDYQHERDQPFIEQACSLIKSDHHSVTLDQKQLLEGLHDAMTARGFPGMADVDSSLLLLARQIASSNRFVLSGECADEVFGGYPWFHTPRLIALDGFPWSGDLALRESVLRAGVREKLELNRYAAARYYEAAARQPRLTGESASQARLRMLHGLCFEWFMPVLQERARCMCSAAGVHVLTPYCDDRLAQYVYNVPWPMKNMGGRTKGLLREAARGVLPGPLLERPKSPYPKTHHPDYAGMVCERMREVLEDRKSPICELLDAQKVLSLMESGMKASAAPWFGQLMTGPQMIAYLLQVNDFLSHYALGIDL